MWGGGQVSVWWEGVTGVCELGGEGYVCTPRVSCYHVQQSKKQHVP